MPTIDSQIARIKSRLCLGLTQERTETIELYAEGLKSKFKEAEYALLRISHFDSINARTTTTSQQQHYESEDQIRFYVDSFFAFLYSTLDVMSQIIDQRLSLINDEQRVRFKEIVRHLEQSPPHIGLPIQLQCTAFKQNRVFIDFERYRNCSTHRRHIYIEWKSGVGSRGYPASRTPGWFICDDPFSLVPTLSKNRELIGYCEKTFNRVRKEVFKILRSI